MSDEWSLKDRDKFFTLIKRVKEIDMDVDIEYFDKEDIETLRQKLIEDLKELWMSTLEGTDIKERLINIINKRFGVE